MKVKTIRWWGNLFLQKCTHHIFSGVNFESIILWNFIKDIYQSLQFILHHNCIVCYWHMRLPDHRREGFFWFLLEYQFIDGDCIQSTAQRVYLYPLFFLTSTHYNRVNLMLVWSIWFQLLTQMLLMVMTTFLHHLLTNFKDQTGIKIDSFLSFPHNGFLYVMHYILHISSKLVDIRR